MPPEWGQYFGPGTGGVITHNAVDAEPRCVERAKTEGDKIYAGRPGPAGPGGGARGCVDPAGPVGRRQLGPIRLGMSDRDVRARLGDPVAVRRGFLRYCAVGGGSYLVGQPGDRSGEFGSDPGALTVMLWSNSPRLLPRAKAVRRAKVVARIGRTRVVRVRKRPWLLAGVRGKRVRWVAVRDTRRARSLKVWLRRTR